MSSEAINPLRRPQPAVGVLFSQAAAAMLHSTVGKMGEGRATEASGAASGTVSTRQEVSGFDVVFEEEGFRAAREETTGDSTPVRGEQQPGREVSPFHQSLVDQVMGYPV